jgi:hypothetical protein
MKQQHSGNEKMERQMANLGARLEESIKRGLHSKLMYIIIIA